MALIPLDEVSRRLALSRRTYLGLQEIPVDRIVGSVDRSADFRRDFKPQRRLSRGRLASLRRAFPDGVMPTHEELTACRSSSLEPARTSARPSRVASGAKDCPSAWSPETRTSWSSSPRISAAKGSARKWRLPTSATRRRLSLAIGSLAGRLSAVDVLEYSPVPAGEYMQPILETPVDDVCAALEFSVLGAVAAVRTVIGPMLDRGSRTILFTTGGAAINPNPVRAAVGISFVGEVAYARMLYTELEDRGIHVGHTAIGGSIARDGDHQPDEVAEILWRHHTQRGEFQVPAWDRLGVAP